MGTEEIERLLGDLEEDSRVGWRVALPRRFNVFEQRVVLKIATEWTDVPPRPNKAELNLARLILANLELIIQRASEGYMSYCAPHDREPQVHARKLEILIDREMVSKKGTDRWGFSFGRDDWPDGEIRVEFEGLTVIETWGGD